ncbi:hypothetical protein KUV50_13440 [Membranicola marinus]|uniref:Uncharacterized protein n=1 Tax=Membranihabitans marinus TaxID=1227546 RepID=A0A953HVD5_9BACT|nr:DUF6364 family protein [Membranihabitans marinus]MBY5959150.1 hypothetical protein [Membranihabitans marinus]
MSKLTLSIDNRVIKRAKDFAKKSNRSLSNIVETDLDKITREDDPEVDDELDQITGIIDLPDDIDVKKEIRTILAGKY